MAKEEKKQYELIRILGTDVRTSLSLVYGLTKIKGVGFMFANAMCTALKFDKNKKIGELSDKEVEKLEDFFQNPEKSGIPEWMLNQRKDIFSGKNLHHNGKELEFNELQIRRRLLKTKSYRAIRTKNNLPRRGQRTKANFRRKKTLASMKSKTTGGKN